MYNTEEFLERYRELEEWANDNYGYDSLRNKELYWEDYKIQNELYYFKSVRNILSHRRNKQDGDQDAFIELTDNFKLRFDTLCRKLMDRITTVCVSYSQIYKRLMADKVISTISTMKEKSYTYVPIMLGKKVWGVFSEFTIFTIASEGQFAQINDNSSFVDIRKYITEYSPDGVFDFAPGSATIEDVREIFSDALEKGRRLDVLFITNTGTKEGDLLGLITVWDFPKF